MSEGHGGLAGRDMLDHVLYEHFDGMRAKWADFRGVLIRHGFAPDVADRILVGLVLKGRLRKDEQGFWRCEMCPERSP